MSYNTAGNYFSLNAVTQGVGYRNLCFASDGGNLLLGTTTDSSNGKLQLATHTTSAGGIGFGAYTSLYLTSDLGYLQINNSSTAQAGLYFGESSGRAGYLGSSAGVLFLGTTTAKSIVLQTNNTTALTLDSSQRVLIGGASTARGTLTIGDGNGGGNSPAASTSDLTFGSSGNRKVLFLGTSTNTSQNGEIGAWNTIYNHQNSKIIFDQP